MEQAPSSLPSFAFSGLATILHLNIRKEGPDDEKVLAVDVKMQGTVNGDRACAFFDAGYNRAARLLETMEGLGYVSAMQSNGTRTVQIALDLTGAEA